MAKKNWMKMLHSMEGAVDKAYDPFATVLRSPSPSVNFTFGNTHGFPLGFTSIFFGPPAGGKSLLANAFIGQMHKDDSEALAIKFNTEEREEIQSTPKMRRIWGIDDDRYEAFNVNKPELIFDRIEKDISAMCDEGAPIKLIVIDSINLIHGRRSLNADSITVQQIGDEAKTLQDGFKRILHVQRKHRIGIILTSHIRAEMDTLEQMRGNKVRMGASFGVQHFAEYFLFVEQNRNKEGRTDLLGGKFEDESNKDITGKHGDITGHKIRVTMKKSSCGPKLRVGEFTLDYDKGVINEHEELFLLGTNRNIIERPNNQSYEFAGKKWVGKPAMLQALSEDVDLRKSIVSELKKKDMAGAYKMDDAAAEQAEENEAGEE